MLYARVKFLATSISLRIYEIPFVIIMRSFMGH